jgi:AbrB family looped-hinge helix DNA binding protein
MNETGPAVEAEKMRRIADGLPTKAAKVRALSAAGYSRSDIARFLDVRYQQVYNVLKRSEPAKDRLWVKVGAGGRILIPAAYRRVLGLAKGSDVQVRLEEDEIRIVPLDTVVRQAQALVREYVPEGVSLSEDLIRERRREAAKEEAESRPRKRRSAK